MTGAGPQPSPARCPFRAAVDRHFAGRVRPEEEVALRAHLPGCPLCHARYERQLLMARLARDPLAGVDRLAIGLGLSIAGRPTRMTSDGRWLAGGVMAAACLAWFLGRDPAAPAPAPEGPASAAAPASPAPEPAHPAAAPDESGACLTLIEDHQRLQCRVVPAGEGRCADR
jgi:hypothetical protein